jgi:hypothetical protein
VVESLGEIDRPKEIRDRSLFMTSDEIRKGLIHSVLLRLEAAYPLRSDKQLVVNLEVGWHTTQWLTHAVCQGLPANDEAQTPRWGRPNTIVFSNPLRVIGVVCSAWLALFFYSYQRKYSGNDLIKSRFIRGRRKLCTSSLPVQALDLVRKDDS